MEKRIFTSIRNIEDAMLKAKFAGYNVIGQTIRQKGNRIWYMVFGRKSW